MQTKTLQIIQKLAKIGKILCKVIFILSLVGAIGCAVGIITLAVIPEGFKLGGLTIHSWVESKAEVTLGTCYAAMAMGVIFCTGEAVLCCIAGRYFKNELAAGTPFTFDGAKEMLRLGIYTICIPIGTAILAGITYGIMKLAMNDVGEIHTGSYVSVGLGVMFIFTSLLCKHGAEIAQGGAQSPEVKG